MMMILYVLAYVYLYFVYCSSSTYRIAFSTPAVLLIWGYPLFSPLSSLAWNYFMSASGFVMALKCVELLQMPRHKALSFLDYIKFYGLALHNEMLVRQYTTQSSYHRATLRFLRGLLKFFFFNGVSVIWRRYFLASNIFVQSYLCGWSLYLLLSSALDCLLALYGLLGGLQYSDVWKNPHLATSPYDFWHHRWNMLIRGIFHRVVFAPAQVVHAAQPSRLPRHVRRALASLVVFLLSGVFHEKLVYVLLSRVTGTSMLFFFLQWCFVTLQIYFQSRFPIAKRVPTPIAILLHHGLLFLVCPLFFAPYLESNALGLVPTAASNSTSLRH
eukprot:GILJ01007112.1.p1 GENE.GILJ01007112.1~~GILJ01007112.1.p1  ORF type:complete len:328 (-),score=30.95 GILJ01007112.1:65-1048(-)